MTRHSLLYFSISLFSFYSCTDNEVSNIKDVNPNVIFFEYKIRGEENESNITVYLQFKRGGPNGTPLILNDPAKVELDGELVSRDSAKLTGTFYETRKPANGFEGKHTIIFTDIDDREYREEFDYTRFKLKTRIPATINRGELQFDFEGLEDEDYLRVSLTDTSFMSKDINEIDTVKNGRVIIPLRKLKNLVDGPITLQLYKEIERPVTNGTKAGGRIVVSYGMQRLFELKAP